MKVSQDLLIGIAIGAGIAMLINSKQVTSGPVKNPKTLPPMKPPMLPGKGTQAQYRVGFRPWSQKLPLHA